MKIGPFGPLEIVIIDKPAPGKKAEAAEEAKKEEA